MAIIIIISIILSILSFLFGTWVMPRFLNGIKISIKEHIKWVFSKNRTQGYAEFNIIMMMFLFVIYLIGGIAYYNTYIDKTNPNYYKNKIKNEQSRVSN